MNELLHTQRLLLRPPTAQDWPAFRNFFATERSTGVGGPKEAGAAWRDFAAEIGHWHIRGYGMWAVTRRGDDRALGLIGPWHPIDWPETEIGWMIFALDIEGTGIATEAARAAIAHAYGTLGWETVVHYIDADNARSIGLAQKLGAVHDITAQAPAAYPGAVVYRSPRPEDQA